MRDDAARGRRLWLALIGVALVSIACGVGGDTGAQQATPTPAVGWSGEVDDAPYVAYERVSVERLPRARLEPAGELRLSQPVRRVPAFRLRDSVRSAIRFTEDSRGGWLAWQPAVVLRARRDLAQAAGAQPSEITTLGVARVEWPDTCLGIPRPETSCAPVVAPGFRVTLRVSGVTAVYHTDLAERVVRAPG